MLPFQRGSSRTYVRDTRSYTHKVRLQPFARQRKQAKQRHREKKKPIRG